MNLNFDEEIKKQKRKKLIKTSLIWMIEIIIVIAVAYFVIHFCYRRTNTIGSTMEPTLYNGQEVFINTKAYVLTSPKREAVIAFYEKEKQEGEEEPLISIRRVIGLPGEKIKITDGKVWINGEEYQSKYTYSAMTTGGIAEQEQTLSEDEYFVLGDNRNASADSRDPSVGVISGKDIVGRAWLRIWPLNKFGILKHQ